ncbi:Protein CBG10271 [Caenorhabditis briggsae]|uniref:Histone-lysine N-methyltransferase, H3 lysine-79 specific n=1 Tax=Caenorhabditis briggsae TaxID=6238 RepID=A8XAQ6_CAEBR|nr:Protein CBG10271 [Caenorhabditis briggsae]CAP29721.2 Protein CBG10271 [Caenorhabditis briggsae]
MKPGQTCDDCQQIKTSDWSYGRPQSNSSLENFKSCKLITQWTKNGVFAISAIKRNAPSKDAGRDSKIAAKVEKWSIESVCKYGRSLDFTSNEPNAASVIKTLFKEIHGSVLSKLNIHPLHWDECADSELGPFLKTFNNSVKVFRKNNPRDVLLSKENWRQKEASEFRVICDLACQLAIPNPRVLNTYYAGFSSGTYGETNIETLQKILDLLGVKEDDVFIDLGSGIGQLVTFAAAYTNIAHVRSIELQQVPAGFADENARQFKKLMRHFGEKPRPFELELGDFNTEETETFLKEKATIIFCNNLAFDPGLMIKLRAILQFCNNGTKIVVTQKLETTKKGRTPRDYLWRNELRTVPGHSGPD